MTGKLHHHTQHAERFAFTPENRTRAQDVIAKYPPGKQQSAVMPLLMLAQRQHHNWLPKAAMDHVAELLAMPPVRVYEVATFYTMYNLEPVGRHLVEVCTTTPCWLRGSDGIVEACERHLGIGCGETSADGQFTLKEAECLGACVNAPMCQITSPHGDYYYEDLTPESMAGLLEALERGEEPKSGPQNGRKSSEPEKR